MQTLVVAEVVGDLASASDPPVSFFGKLVHFIDPFLGSNFRQFALFWRDHCGNRQFMNPTDLIRIAELIRLAVEAGRLFSDSRLEGDGRLSRVTELCAQIDIAAIELGEIGNRMVAEQPIT